MSDRAGEPKMPGASPTYVGEAALRTPQIEVDAMSDEKRPEAEKNLGLFMAPSGVAGGGGLFTPMNSLIVGPGEPGPGDDWEFPTEPTDGPDAEKVPAAKPDGSTEA
jgi:hypothetical protein